MSHFAYAMGARIIARSPRRPTDEHEPERDRDREGALARSARRVGAGVTAFWRRLWRLIRRPRKVAPTVTTSQRPLTSGRRVAAPES